MRDEMTEAILRGESMSEAIKATKVLLWGAEMRGYWVKETDDCFRVDFFVEGEAVGGFGLSEEGLRQLSALVNNALEEREAR